MSSHGVANLATYKGLHPDRARQLWQASGSGFDSFAAAAAVTIEDVKAATAADAATVVANITNTELLAQLWSDRRVKVREALVYNPHLDAATAYKAFMWQAKRGNDVPATLFTALGAHTVCEAITELASGGVVTVIDLHIYEAWRDVATVEWLTELLACAAADSAAASLIETFDADTPTHSEVLGLLERARPASEARSSLVTLLAVRAALTPDAIDLVADDEDTMRHLMGYVNDFAELPTAAQLERWARHTGEDQLLVALANTATRLDDPLDVPAELPCALLRTLDRFEVYTAEGVCPWIVAASPELAAEALVRCAEHVPSSQAAQRAFAELVIEVFNHVELPETTASDLVVAATSAFVSEVDSFVGSWATGEFAKNPPCPKIAERAARTASQAQLAQLVGHPELWSVALFERLDAGTRMALGSLSSDAVPLEVRTAFAERLCGDKVTVQANEVDDVVAAAVRFIAEADIEEAARMNLRRLTMCATALLTNTPVEPRHVVELLDIAEAHDRWLEEGFEANPPNPAAIHEVLNETRRDALRPREWSMIARRDDVAVTDRVAAACAAEDVEVLEELLDAVEVSDLDALFAAIAADVDSSEEIANVLGQWLVGQFEANQPTDELVAELVAEYSVAKLDAGLWEAARREGSLPAEVAQWLGNTPGLANRWASEAQPLELTERVVDLLGLDANAPVTSWLCAAELAAGFEGSFNDLAALLETTRLDVT